MDPYASSQDIQRCQDYDDGIAELFCVCCDTKLCKRCIGAHLVGDPEKHNIVKNIDKYKMLLFPECATHAKEQCKNDCQQCDLAVCSSCISTKSHEHHKFLKIVDIFNQMKEIIKIDSDELELKILPSYEVIVKEVKYRAEKLQESFDRVLNNIKKQRKMWHQEIDNIVNALKENVSGMKKMQMKAQNDHLSRLRELLLDVKKAVQRNKDILESLEISKSLSYKSMNSILMSISPKLEISVPRFIPKVIENELNSEKIGVITGFCITNQKGGYKLKSPSGGVPKDKKNFERNISKQVLGDPQIVATFKTSINVECPSDK